MTEFTPITSALGGILIGLAAALLLYAHGRIAGISGIINGVIDKTTTEESIWRSAFIVGIITTGFALSFAYPHLFETTVFRSIWAIGLAGFLVGLGTRLGNGCTSGHGVCGLSRLSFRSLFATISFILSGVLTVLVIRIIFGGNL